MTPVSSERLVELAGRVEVLAGPDRTTFYDAFRTVFPKPSRIWVTDSTGDWTPEYTTWSERQHRFCEFLEAEAYLDAAMTLVPEGCGNALRSVIGKRPCASIQFPDTGGLPPMTTSADGWTDWCGGHTPALALLAASLRALALRDHLLSTNDQGDK